MHAFIVAVKLGVDKDESVAGALVDMYASYLASLFLLNRGLYHFKRKEWANIKEDSRRALALDDNVVKVRKGSGQ
ncbi:hypothetical protein ABZP36_009069 [Zizania latifolia]